MSGNLLAVERQVTDSLLTMLAGELRPEGGKPLPSDSSDLSSAHPDAYQYYVRGVGYVLEYQNADSLQSAIALFRAALERTQSSLWPMPEPLRLIGVCFRRAKTRAGFQKPSTPVTVQQN